MGLPIMYTREGGVGCEYIGVGLPCSSTGEPPLWVGDVGSNLPHGADPGGGLPLGGEISHRLYPLSLI